MTSKRDTPIGELHKAEIAKLQRDIKQLEQEIEFCREMVSPNGAAVFLAAMNWYKVWSGDSQKSAYGLVTKLASACKRARGGK